MSVEVERLKLAAAFSAVSPTHSAAGSPLPFPPKQKQESSRKNKNAASPLTGGARGGVAGEWSVHTPTVSTVSSGARGRKGGGGPGLDSAAAGASSRPQEHHTHVSGAPALDDSLVGEPRPYPPEPLVFLAGEPRPHPDMASGPTHGPPIATREGGVDSLSRVSLSSFRQTQLQVRLHLPQKKFRKTKSCTSHSRSYGLPLLTGLY